MDAFSSTNWPFGDTLENVENAPPAPSAPRYAPSNNGRQRYFSMPNEALRNNVAGGLAGLANGFVHQAVGGGPLRNAVAGPAGYGQADGVPNGQADGVMPGNLAHGLVPDGVPGNVVPGGQAGGPDGNQAGGFMPGGGYADGVVLGDGQAGNVVVPGGQAHGGQAGGVVVPGGQAGGIVIPGGQAGGVVLPGGIEAQGQVFENANIYANVNPINPIAVLNLAEPQQVDMNAQQSLINIFFIQSNLKFNVIKALKNRAVFKILFYV